MTVTLAYDSVLSRVRVNADALIAVDRAKLERSTNQVVWKTVRGGADIPLTGGSLLLPGTTGNYASTPDNAALDITGDIDLRADATMGNWLTSTVTFLAKWTPAAQQSYLLDTDGTGHLRIIWSTTGANQFAATSTATLAPPSSGRLAVRATLDVDNGAAGRTATFYTASTMAGPWTQLGVPVVQGGTTSIFSSTAILEVGSFGAGTSDFLPGTVHAAEVRNGIGSTVVALPNFEFLAAGTTGFTDGAGRVWTLNGTAAIPTRQFPALVDDYEFTSGVTNSYRVSAITPPAGLFLPGVAFSFASTPDNAALDIVGDIDLRADMTLDDWTPVANVSPITKWGGVQLSYLLAVNPTGNIVIAWSNDGTAVLSATSTVPVPAANGQRLAIRATLDVNNGAGGRTITFYTAASIDGVWAQLGAAVVVGATTSIFAGTQQMEVGSHSGGTADLFRGTVHAIEVRNGIGGTAVANPNFAAQPMGTTGFTDAAGRVWSIGFARIINSVTVTIVPVLDRIWLKSIARPFLNRPVTVVGFTDPARPSRSSESDVVSRSLPVAVNDLRSSRRWAMTIHVATAADAQTMDYILASGDVMLIHTPRMCDVPGGYVTIKDYGQRHPDGRVRGATRIFTLPLVEVAPPGPDVIGATSTWDSILAAFPTWDDVLAAFPAWDDVLAYIGDPSEVIVP